MSKGKSDKQEKNVKETKKHDHDCKCEGNPERCQCFHRANKSR